MRVVYVPGFMGSYLSYDQAGSQDYFFDVGQLAGRSPATSGLAVNGIDPVVPGGVQLYPTRAYGFALLSSLLLPQLPEPSAIEAFPWDWRKDIRAAGRALWTLIDGSVADDGNVSIVAHSAGGLVALQAAMIAYSVRRTSKIRRIVLLGSPMQGSYVTQQFLAGALAAVAASFLATPVANFVTTLGFIAGPFMRSLLFSWPGFVQLFPFLGGTDARGDPARQDLFSPVTYPDVPLAYTYARLSDALGFQSSTDMALSVASGTGLLVMGIGQGFATVNRLPQGPARVPPGPFLGTTEGDRVVTRLSAEKPADARFVSEWSHGELVVNFAASGSLAQALLLEDPNLRFGSELPVENLPMTLVPLTNTTLISLLNQTHRFRELFTVVGFTTQDPTKPYVFTLDRSMRRAHRFARVISGDVGGVYVFNGTAWFYVPSPKITRFFV